MNKVRAIIFSTIYLEVTTIKNNLLMVINKTMDLYKNQ